MPLAITDLPLPAPGIDADYWSLRFVEETSQSFSVRKDVAQPLAVVSDRGVMASVYADGGYGYAATGDTSEQGLRRVLEQAADWAKATARYALDDSRALPRPAPRGDYASPSLRAPLPTAREWYEMLLRESQCAGCDPGGVDWEALVDVLHATHRLITSEGGDVVQRFRFLFPSISVTAHADGVTQQRSLNGYRGIAQQGGLEILARFGFTGAGTRIAEEALELLAAENCPSGRMDVLLAPDQMVLQIHESIGHPLELDRILGDERNFAGTSFVTPDMFGRYRYGSEHLDITFDPTRPEELASYAFDDEGTPAERTYLIRKGVLERPLGGAISQARAGLPGVANARANGWNRPPIDRMANLNLEPGRATFDELVAGIEHGIMMETNSSWSIDDSRNKFQFGCERARIIDGGKLGRVVKNPNYRGISAEFWRSLAHVGNADTVRVLGTPFCGKGEPGQTIRVGHASPACVFTNVDVFGGES
jgi:predicted Zn-dependent protease